eukprot:GHVS01042537.1.p2 GENE.GHVS01042537.1~~GHVS01042537.1.p2  ORF type:complete len:456 (+),score=68.88 GHVS01042537.1:1557-2924(+)
MRAKEEDLMIEKNEELKKKVEELTSKDEELRRARIERSELQRTLDDLSANLNRVEAQLSENLQKNRNGASIERSELQITLDETVADMRAKDDELERASIERSELQRTLDVKDKQVKRAGIERSELQRTLDAKEEDRMKLKMKVEELTSKDEELIKLSANIDRFEVHMSEVSAKAVRLGVQLSENKAARLSELQKHRNELKMTVEELKLKGKQLTNDKADHVAELKKNRTAKDEELRKNKAAHLAELQKNRNELKMKVEELKSKDEELRTKDELLRKNKADHLAELQKNRNDLKTKDEKLRKLSANISRVEAQLSVKVEELTLKDKQLMNDKDDHMAELEKKRNALKSKGRRRRVPPLVREQVLPTVVDLDQICAHAGCMFLSRFATGYGAGSGRGQRPSHGGENRLTEYRCQVPAAALPLRSRWRRWRIAAADCGDGAANFTLTAGSCVGAALPL